MTPARKRMRMAELANQSGVSRDTIHYYLREGLLPKPIKSGKTVAYYDDEHLERLRLIRRLRDEKYLPVAVIRRLLETGPLDAQGRDLDTLADVLSIDPTLSRPDAAPELLDDEATRVALQLGLLGENVRSVESLDPSEARVLAAVAEALSLEGDARQLTLDDMQVCGRELSRLVQIEAGLFFDLVLESGDTPRAVQALRAGRTAVAHFITAFRDLMLRRITDDVLHAMSSGPGALSHPRILPLSEARLLQLGARARRTELYERARAGDAGAANDLVWHLAVVGPVKELPRLPTIIQELLRPRAELLVRLVELEQSGGHPDELERILARAAPFPLGEVLIAEASLVRVVQRGARGGNFFDQFVAALHRLGRAEPEQDADPLAAAVAFHRRGQIRLLLPRVLGRGNAAAADLARALEVVIGSPGRIAAAARARLEGNARLSLGRLHAELGARELALDHLERARAIDPDGPIGSTALEEMKKLRSAT